MRGVVEDIRRKASVSARVHMRVASDTNGVMICPTFFCGSITTTARIRRTILDISYISPDNHTHCMDIATLFLLFRSPIIASLHPLENRRIRIWDKLPGNLV